MEQSQACHRAVTDPLPRYVPVKCRGTTGPRTELVHMLCFTIIATFDVGNASKLMTQRRGTCSSCCIYDGEVSNGRVCTKVLARRCLSTCFGPRVAWQATPALVEGCRLRQRPHVMQRHPSSTRFSYNAAARVRFRNVESAPIPRSPLAPRVRPQATWQAKPSVYRRRHGLPSGVRTNTKNYRQRRTASEGSRADPTFRNLTVIYVYSRGERGLV